MHELPGCKMCPFSHGIAIVFSIFICLQVNGGGISCGPVDVHRKVATLQSTPVSLPHYPLPSPVSAIPKEGKHVEQTTNPGTWRLKMAERPNGKPHFVLLPHQKSSHTHSGHEQKQSLICIMYRYCPDLFAHSEYKQRAFNNAGEPYVALNNFRPGREMHFTSTSKRLLENIGKLQTLLSISCPTCDLKSSRKRSRLKNSEQRKTNRILTSTNPPDDRKKRIFRFHRLALRQLFTPSSGHSRSKRSLKNSYKPLKGRKGNRRRVKHKTVPKKEVNAAPVPTVLNTTQESLRENISSTQTPGRRKTNIALTDVGKVNAALTEGERQSTVLTDGGQLATLKDQNHEAGSPQRQQTNKIAKPLFQRIDGSGEVADRDLDMENTTYLGLDGKPVDLKKLLATLTEKEFRRQLSREAQWAYMCLVILMCVMMWTIWCLGGLQRCRYRPDNPVHFDDKQPLVTVHDVLRKTRQYLPMFNEPEWEEVLMANRGTDP